MRPMNDETNQRSNEGNDGGPEGTEFLQLEVSRWLEGGARAEAEGLLRELLRGAVRDRLEARLGDRIRAVGAAIADQIADDLEANLAIEAIIDARRDAHRASSESIPQLFRAATKSAKGPDEKRKKR